MAGFKPYPIFDLRTGLALAKEPWLLPPDAFTKLENFYLDKGVLKKRKGYVEYGRAVHYGVRLAVASFAAVGDGSTTTTVTTTLHHGGSNADEFIIVGTTNYDGIYAIANKTDHTFEITKAYVAESGAYTKTVQKKTNSTSAIMGMHTYYNNDVGELMVFDRTRVNIRNDSGSRFDDLTTERLYFTSGGTTAIVAGNTLTNNTNTATVHNVVLYTGSWAGGDATGELHISNQSGAFASGALMVGGVDLGTIAADTSIREFTGDDDKFFSCVNWKNKAYYVNGKDQLGTYNGTVLGRIQIDLDVLGGPDNDVSTAKFVFVYKNHLLLLSPTVDSAFQPQRAMWSEALVDNEWESDQFADCPTNDVIVSAGFIGEQLVVFFNNSVWRLDYTGNSAMPFKWLKLLSLEGSAAPMSTIVMAKDIFTMGATRLIGTNASSVYNIDELIPDIQLSFKQAQTHYNYSLLVNALKQAWMSFVSMDNNDTSPRPDSVLVMNYDDKNWSTYLLDSSCFGTFVESDDPTFDGIGTYLGDSEMALDDIDIALDDLSLQEGYPIYLTGSIDGYIYKLNTGGTDDGSAITCDAISGWWNPYAQEGQLAEFGWIDFLVESQADATLDINLFMNHADTSYRTETLKFDAEHTGATKTWFRVFVNAVAEFHRIEIEHSASNQTVEISAVVPYFRPAGDIN